MLPVIKHRTNHREMTARLLLICLGTLLGCIITEAGIRLFGIGKPQFYTYSRWRGWKMLPRTSRWQTDQGRAWPRVNRWSSSLEATSIGGTIDVFLRT